MSAESVKVEIREIPCHPYIASLFYSRQKGGSFCPGFFLASSRLFCEKEALAKEYGSLGA